MPIHIVRGDLLKQADVDAIVNTVNCVGIMGKGIALQFRNKWPDNARAYEQACKAGKVRPGKMFIFDLGGLIRPGFIINFPTKDHWRGKSKTEFIEDGLVDLVREVSGCKSALLPFHPWVAGTVGCDGPMCVRRSRMHFPRPRMSKSGCLNRQEPLIRGVGDGVVESEIELDARALTEASDFLARADDEVLNSYVERVSTLIDGFQTPYGMELLATVHWVVTRENSQGPEEAAEAVARWNERKRMIMPPAHVAAAWERLAEGGWIPSERPPIQRSSVGLTSSRRA